MINLPKEKTVATDQDPKLMVMISHTKVGKTSLLAELPNCLIIDLEEGSKYVDAMKLNLVKVARDNNISNLQALRMIVDEISTANEENGSPVYDYIAIDTTTALERLAEEFALMMYKKSPQGETFDGDSVLELAHGSGYDWLRRAFVRLYQSFLPLPNKALILVGHTKTASIQKDGKELGARDIQLTGKLKTIVCADADAIGFMFRTDPKTNVLTFKTNEQDLVTGARPAHLKDAEFTISELLDDGSLKTHWDKVFTTLK